MQEIILDFDDDDNPVVAVKGVKGKACKDLTKSMEEALGVVTSDTPTAEMRQEDRSGARVPNRR